MKDFFDDNISGVCALIPGVLGTTGIETAEIIKAVSEKVKPNLIIAVDAMAAADIRRVSSTVQVFNRVPAWEITENVLMKKRLVQR